MQKHSNELDIQYPFLLIFFQLQRRIDNGFILVNKQYFGRNDIIIWMNIYSKRDEKKNHENIFFKYDQSKHIKHFSKIFQMNQNSFQRFKKSRSKYFHAQ